MALSDQVPGGFDHFKSEFHRLHTEILATQVPDAIKLMGSSERASRTLPFGHSSAIPSIPRTPMPPGRLHSTRSRSSLRLFAKRGSTLTAKPTALQWSDTHRCQPTQPALRVATTRHPTESADPILTAVTEGDFRRLKRPPPAKPSVRRSNPPLVRSRPRDKIAPTARTRGNALVAGRSPATTFARAKRPSAPVVNLSLRISQSATTMRIIPPRLSSLTHLRRC